MTDKCVLTLQTNITLISFVRVIFSRVCTQIHSNILKHVFSAQTENIIVCVCVGRRPPGANALKVDGCSHERKGQGQGAGCPAVHGGAAAGGGAQSCSFHRGFPNFRRSFLEYIAAEFCTSFIIFSAFFEICKIDTFAPLEAQCLQLFVLSHRFTDCWRLFQISWNLPLNFHRHLLLFVDCSRKFARFGGNDLIPDNWRTSAYFQYYFAEFFTIFFRARV